MRRLYNVAVMLLELRKALEHTISTVAPFREFIMEPNHCPTELGKIIFVDKFLIEFQSKLCDFDHSLAGIHSP
jgi:hypothetical protein